METTNQERLQKIYEVANDMADLLNKHHISHVELYGYGQYADIESIAVIDIYINGDWKHDHWRSDCLIKDNFNVVQSYSESVEDTGSDWGPEIHHYYVYLPDYK